MKKYFLVIVLLFFFGFAFGQTNPTIGIQPGTATNQILVTKDTLGAKRFVYADIDFRISNDTLYFMDSVWVYLGGYDTPVPDDYVQSVANTATVDLNVNGGGELTADADISAINYWTKSGNKLYALSDSIGMWTSNPSKKIHMVGNTLISGGALTVGSDLASFVDYGFTVNNAAGGILLNRTSTNDAFIRLSNNSSYGFQFRTMTADAENGVQFTNLAGTGFSFISESKTRISNHLETRSGNGGTGGSNVQLKLGFISGNLTTGFAYSQAIKTRHSSSTAANNGIEFWTWTTADGTYGNPSVFCGIFENGKLGVATQDPTEPLDVVGNVKYTGALKPGGSAGTSGYLLTSSGGGANTWTNPATLGTTYTFTNGLTNTAGTVKLGGTLTAATTLTAAGNNFEINQDNGTLALANIWNNTGYTQNYVNGTTTQYTYKLENSSTLFWDAYYPGANRSNITVAQNNIGLFSDNLTNSEQSAVNTAPASITMSTTDGTTTSQINTSPVLINLIAPERLKISGTVAHTSVQTKATTFTAALGTRVYICTTGAAFTASLPASPQTGDEYILKRVGANTLTISGNGKNIDGAASISITTNYVATHVYYSGTEWLIIN